MIIKNASQLKSAKVRYEKIQQKINEYDKKYTGFEHDFYVGPLIIEIQELENQIEEYLKLTKLPIDRAINEVLAEPILLDNVSDLLTKLRIASNITQEEMANHLGWKQSNLSRFESENYSSQTISKIVEFASSLEVWLHISPSLTEEPKKGLHVQLQKEVIKTPFRDIVTTSSDLQSPLDEYDLDIPKVTPLRQDIPTPV